jgi:hypothetical protein
MAIQNTITNLVFPKEKSWRVSRTAEQLSDSKTLRFIILIIFSEYPEHLIFPYMQTELLSEVNL